MKKQIGIACMALILAFSLGLQKAKMGPEIGADSEYDDGCGYMFETILAGNDIVRGEFFILNGYFRLYENGIALYYSKQDYIYDTRENAIWMPEREDCPLNEIIKKMEEESKITTDNNGIQMITFLPLVVENLGEKSEYAAIATYIVGYDDYEQDPEFQKIKLEKAKEEVIYDKKELEKEAIKVSFYRLLGDPWRYDGKKVQIECNMQGESLSAVSSEITEKNGSKIAQIFDYLVDEKEVWINIMKKYEFIGDLYYTSAIFGGDRCRVEGTVMFYVYWLNEGVYWPGEEFLEESKPWVRKYCYELLDLNIHEKDLEYVKNRIIEKQKDIGV